MTRIFPLPETAHHIVRQNISQGSIAVDATAGNGHDTAFLAKLVHFQIKNDEKASRRQYK